MGSIATQSKNEEEEDSDIPETGFLNSPTGNFVKDIPGEVGSSWDNKVYRSKAGHIIQLDNTENKEKISNIIKNNIDKIKSTKEEDLKCLKKNSTSGSTGEATIFFSDIVGFTEISSILPPLKISDLLERELLSFRHDYFP